jgi:hypothetical protein
MSSRFNGCYNLNFDIFLPDDTTTLTCNFNNHLHICCSKTFASEWPGSALLEWRELERPDDTKLDGFLEWIRDPARVHKGVDYLAGHETLDRDLPPPAHLHAGAVRAQIRISCLYKVDACFRKAALERLDAFGKFAEMRFGRSCLRASELCCLLSAQLVQQGLEASKFAASPHLC